MELKTEQDPLTLGDLLKLQAYTWLYEKGASGCSEQRRHVRPISHSITTYREGS